MSERISQEVALLRTAYPDLEYRPEGDVHWVRIVDYPMPGEMFKQKEIELVFQIPPQAGVAPYGFSVRPSLELIAGGVPNNYTFPGPSNPWGADFGQFSWAPESWAPKDDIRAGSNMLNFARSISDRLREGA